MSSDTSGNWFELKEFPDWNNFDHNHSGVKTMTMFQSDAKTSSIFDNSEITAIFGNPRDKQLRIIYTASIKGIVSLDASQNSFIFDEPQIYVPFVKIVQVI